MQRWRWWRGRAVRWGRPWRGQQGGPGGAAVAARDEAGGQTVAEWRAGERTREQRRGGGVAGGGGRTTGSAKGNGRRAPGERPRPCVRVWAGEKGRGSAAMGVFRGAGARRGCGERGQRAYEAVVRGVRRRGEHVRGPVGECARRRRGRGGGATVLGWVGCWLGRPTGWAAQVSFSPFFSVSVFI